MRLPRIIAFVITTAILLYLAYFCYTNIASSNTIVEIYPDKTPTKIKPNDSDGISVKNTDNGMYENLQSKAVSNRKVTLLPEPEEPMSIKSSELKLEDTIDPFEDVFFKVENSPLTEEETPNTTLRVVQVEDNHHAVATEKKSEVKKGDRYKVQLASVKTQGEASIEWDRIRRSHSKILGNAKVIFRRVDHENGKFFYLVIAGNYENLSQAKAVCKKLSTRQQSCIVTK